MDKTHEKVTRPNIVLILADDHGQWAMGCSGNKEVRTPNLDALAASGLRFDNFFCTSPVCSPARASILTGQIPSQHGILDWLRRGESSRAWSKGKETDKTIEYLAGQTGYTDLLAAAGYPCGISGKWHMGDADHAQKGFSSWRVNVSGTRYQNPVFTDGKEFIQEKGYLTDITTDYALGFIEKQKDADKPFYLSVHYNAPHAPWFRELHPEATFDDYMANCPFRSTPNVPMHAWMPDTPEKTGRVYPEKSYPRDETERRERLSGYYAAITEMDRNIGRLVEALDRTGLRENTLLIYLSDNGMNLGHHGIYGKGNCTFPMNMYDTSVKVPLIINRPGHVPEGQVVAELFSQYDIMPTLLDYTDIENPEAERLPGRSFAPVLRGEACEGRPGVVVFDEYGPVRMVRTQEWKYVHRYPYGPHELYDLRSDPEELHNLISSEGMGGRAAELKAMLEDWFRRYVDPERDGVYEPVTGEGQIGLIGPKSAGHPAFEKTSLIKVRGAGLAEQKYP